MSRYLFLSLTFFSLRAIAGISDTNAVKQDTIPAIFLHPQRRISLVAGYNYFFGNGYAELGIARNSFGGHGHHPFGMAGFVSSEFWADKNRTVIGPKIGCWAAGGASAMAMGANLIYYTDFSAASFRFRPEIGFGFEVFKMTYGYNLPITNRDFMGISKHSISAALLIGVKKLNERKQVKHAE
jgi:hypothetical protein